jgi:hypothetical protein
VRNSHLMQQIYWIVDRQQYNSIWMILIRFENKEPKYRQCKHGLLPALLSITSLSDCRKFVQCWISEFPKGLPPSFLLCDATVELRRCGSFSLLNGIMILSSFFIDAKGKQHVGAKTARKIVFGWMKSLVCMTKQDVPNRHSVKLCGHVHWSGYCYKINVLSTMSTFPSDKT